MKSEKIVTSVLVISIVLLWFGFLIHLDACKKRDKPIGNQRSEVPMVVQDAAPIQPYCYEFGVDGHTLQYICTSGHSFVITFDKNGMISSASGNFPGYVEDKRGN